MASEAPNLALIYADDKTDWIGITSRLSPEHMPIVQEAAEKLGLKITHFYALAIVERALQVTGRVES